MNEALFGFVAARLRASVVEVHARGSGDRGSGAGIAWRPGIIVTNAHVATAARMTIVTSDGREVEGRVVRRDPRRDLAVVQAADASVPPVDSIDPRQLRPGSLVFAMGHPLGVKDAVSVGVLQAVGPFPSEIAPGIPRGLDWVQADVRLAPGNSGGPIADAEGRVIGVSAMIVAGLALAVPATDVESLVVRAESGARPGAAVTMFG